MSNTSIRNIPTLKGIFTVPPNTQGRNFLQENKKSLRSLEKTTSEKLAAKEPVRPKWMPPLRRTSSEVHVPEREPKQSQSECLSSSRQRTKGTCATRSQHSLDKPNGSVKHYAPSEKSVSREAVKQKQLTQGPQLVQQIPETQSQQLLARCQSCGSERSSTASIGIQTEDIRDEIYLANALKKCNFDTNAGEFEDSYSQYNDDEPLSPRSHSSSQLKCQLNIDDNETMPIPDLQQLDLDNADDEAPLSARSRDTIASMSSTATTKSKRREHKLGSRDDLRLPRYLEKEKRDKAEAKERIEAIDPDCPRGHVLLSEEERLATLNAAKNRFDKLIQELNHMPMTAATLRVRSRKAEIDKELTVVEDEIRIYSKAKVYVKLDNSRQL